MVLMANATWRNERNCSNIRPEVLDKTKVWDAPLGGGLKVNFVGSWSVGRSFAAPEMLNPSPTPASSTPSTDIRPGRVLFVPSSKRRVGLPNKLVEELAVPEPVTTRPRNSARKSQVPVRTKLPLIGSLGSKSAVFVS